MERVNIRQQNLDELYQTPENTLESMQTLLPVLANRVVEVDFPFLALDSNTHTQVQNPQSHGTLLSLSMRPRS